MHLINHNKPHPAKVLGPGMAPHLLTSLDRKLALLEETGLDAVHVDASSPYHVDVHPGPRGHTHYDLRYLLRAAPEDPAPAPGETPEVYWFDFAAARERCEPSLVAVLTRLEREMSFDDVRD
jgi:hypothetical protein